jgi:hypothetical protein
MPKQITTPDASAPDAPTQRILIVAETISQFGPITLPELTERLGFSRGAIWRAIDTLRARGWVRMRAGDSAYEMEFSKTRALANGHASNPALAPLLPLFAQLASLGPVHVDIGQFVDTGVFRIVESTRKAAYSGAPLSLVDDDLAIAAQLPLSPQVLVGHLRSYIVDATEEERRVVTSGVHGRVIARLREVGHIWMEDRSAISIALPQALGLAVRCELWRHSKADTARLQAGINAILGAEPSSYAVNSNVPFSVRKT